MGSNSRPPPDIFVFPISTNTIADAIFSILGPSVASPSPTKPNPVGIPGDCGPINESDSLRTD